MPQASELMKLTNGISIGAGIAMSMISLGYWLIQSQQATISAQTSAVQTERPRAYILRGYAVDLTKYTTTLESSVHPAVPGTNRIVLVSSDSCAVCSREGPRWPEQLHALGAGIDDEFVLVTLNSADNLGAALASLRSGRNPWRLLKVTDIQSFVASTGLVATPMITILDSSGYVQAVGKTLKDGDAEIFHRVLSNPMNKGGE